MFVVCESVLVFWFDVHGEYDVVYLCSSCVLYSAGSGVKRVHVVLPGLRMRLHVFHVGRIGCLLLLCLCRCVLMLW